MSDTQGPDLRAQLHQQTSGQWSLEVHPLPAGASPRQDLCVVVIGAGVLSASLVVPVADLPNMAAAFQSAHDQLTAAATSPLAPPAPPALIV
jgi:predicted phage tail protein